MIIEALTIEENAYSGFSHQALITFADFAAQAAGNTATFTIGNVVAQDCVLRGALVVDTAFTFSDGTITTATVSVGDSVGGVTSILAAQNILALTNGVAAVALTWTAAGTLTATVTVTAAKNVNTATNGSLRILFSKNSLTKFKIV